MRLTNFIRDAFIRSAMHDVPKKDYEEQAQKLAREFVKVKFAKDFPSMDYDKAGESGWFESSSLQMPRFINNIYMNVTTGYGMLKNDEKLWAKLEVLSEKKKQQDDNMSTLETRLRGVAYACTTRKQLEDALPEFKAYLPEEEAKAARTLPAVTNVVADFTKAGWPAKGKK